MSRGILTNSGSPAALGFFLYFALLSLVLIDNAGFAQLDLMSMPAPLLLATAVLVATYLVSCLTLAGSIWAQVFLAVASTGKVNYGLALFWCPEPPRRTLLVAPVRRVIIGHT